MEILDRARGGIKVRMTRVRAGAGTHDKERPGPRQRGTRTTATRDADHGNPGRGPRQPGTRTTATRDADRARSGPPRRVSDGFLDEIQDGPRPDVEALLD